METTQADDFESVAPLPIKSSFKAYNGKTVKPRKKPDKLGNSALNLLIVGLLIGTVSSVLLFGVVTDFITISEENYTGLMWIITVALIILAVYCAVSIPAAFIMSFIGLIKRKTPTGAAVSRWKSLFVFVWCMISTVLILFFFETIVNAWAVLVPRM